MPRVYKTNHGVVTRSRAADTGVSAYKKDLPPEWEGEHQGRCNFERSWLKIRVRTLNLEPFWSRTILFVRAEVCVTGSRRSTTQHTQGSTRRPGGLSSGLVDKCAKEGAFWVGQDQEPLQERSFRIGTTKEHLVFLVRF